MVPKRSFFLWSAWGDGLPLAVRLVQDGAKVLFHVDRRHPQASLVGRGLVPTTENPKISRGAIVIFDETGYGALGQKLRLMGHPVIGGNRLEESTELNRRKGAEIMGVLGMNVPETHEFKTAVEAIAFLDEPGRSAQKWYMKLFGHTETVSTYNAPNAEMMIRYLRWWGLQPGPKPRFELQKAMDGFDISCEGFFDGKKFVPPFCATLEEKKLFAGNRGPRTGMESEIVWPLDGDRPELAELTVLRMEPVLRRYHYVGPIDVNSLVSPDGKLHFLEFTARFGYDSTVAWLRILKGSAAEQLEAFALSGLDRWDLNDQVAMTLRLSVPPYPSGSDQEADAQTGLPLDKALLHDDRISLTDVMVDREGLPCLAGRDGQIGTVGSVGSNLAHMRQELLDLAGSLAIPNLQYRVDPIKRAEVDLRALRSHGLLHHKGLSEYLDQLDPGKTTG